MVNQQITKELKPFEPSLGNGYLIDMNELYNYSAVHDEWQKYPDNSGEYKDVVYYTYNAHKLLELINLNYARLESIATQEDLNAQYFFIMRRKY